VEHNNRCNRRPRCCKTQEIYVTEMVRSRLDLTKRRGRPPSLKTIYGNKLLGGTYDNHALLPNVGAMSDPTFGNSRLSDTTREVLETGKGYPVYI
jgi:hypothetical protein